MVVQRTVPTVERFCWLMTRVPSTLVRISSNQLRDVRAALHMLLEARNALAIIRTREWFRLCSLNRRIESSISTGQARVGFRCLSKWQDEVTNRRRAWPMTF
jgi:hypothetical protein